VGEVFVTSRNHDTDLLLRAMRAGTKEFIQQPLNEREIQSALSGFKKRQKQSAISKPLHNGQIIHVIGAKGGVGTTTVAVNLAMVLAEMKKAGSVALVDLNTVFGEIPLFLSVKPTFHWGHITKNVDRLDTEFLLNTMAKHKSGVHILPSPSYLNGHLPATAEIMERLLEAMKHTFDYIIVDGGQSLDGPSIKVMEMSETILLVTLLSLPCLNNTQNLLKSLNNVGTVDQEKLRLIINRYLKKSDISIEDAEKSVRQEIFWNIPNDYKTTMSAINRGIALHDISSKAPITKNFMALTDSLLEVNTIPTKKKGWRLFGRN
jgi:pilus assembly protein CpaE